MSLQILNMREEAVHNDDIALIGFPPDIKTSDEVLDTYLKEVMKCPTKKLREKIIKMTEKDVKDRWFFNSMMCVY